MHVIYDVSHNIAKVEQHVVDGKERTLLVHRKGSTRAFPPHHPLIAVDYQVSLTLGEGNREFWINQTILGSLTRYLNAVSSFFEVTAVEPWWDGSIQVVCVLRLWDTELLLLHTQNI